MNTINSNKLINEKSPYLLQHVGNPVNWYPWSEEAFLKAKEEDKLIFLSIGYSTCHWCHVMAHESFEDEKVANYLNQNYISIKVDREERPDIDSVYMNVCQKITGSGGWPLSVFITSDKKPIYAGTYYPKITFLQLLEKINHLWINNRVNLEKNTLEIIKSIKDNKNNPEEANVSIINKAFSLFTSYFDYTNGGIIGEPKFPTPHNWLFLMKYYQATKNKTALDLVSKTLDSIRKGGIYDHIGFGFCRYSTDKKWLVPHFEKMLYDNALLIIAYCNFYNITKKLIYLETAKEVASYLIRKMQSQDGAFFTAEDADSEGEEGKFYTFTKKEIDNVLGEDSNFYCDYYNITEKGNFEGKNIPNLIGKDINEVDKLKLEECRNKLFVYQKKRIPPLLDDKILTSLNGILIASYSILGRVANNEAYILIAREIADFINNKMFVSNKLMARYKDNEIKYLGYDDDYAYTIMGLIELHQTTLDDKYLNFAIDLNEIFIKNFYDEENGGFYQTDKDGEIILFRNKLIYDGATPSSNSVQIYNLLRLYNLTLKERYRDIANKTINYFTSEAKNYPLGYSFYNIGLLYKIYGSIEITLVGQKIDDVNELLRVIHESNLAFYEIKFVNDGTYKLKDNIPTAYVCKDNNCLSPINEIDKLSRVLNI